MYKQYLALLFSLIISASIARAQDDSDTAAVVDAGREIYYRPASCHTCHGADGTGLVGPTLAFGPTPFDIDYQLRTNELMVPIAAVLELSDDELVAVSAFIRRLHGAAPDAIDVAALASTLAQREALAEELFAKTPRELALSDIEDFAEVVDNWQRRSKTGSLKRSYDVVVAAEFVHGEPKFTPRPGTTYFYENTGTGGTKDLSTGRLVQADSAQIVVGDATTKEIVAYHEIPLELRSAVHSTVMSPDGKHVYIIGSKAFDDGAVPGGPGGLRSPASWLKADALTLQPVKQLIVGGRVHHAQIFQDRYLLVDTFVSDPDGLDIYLFDPVTDEIVGGIQAADLGGRPYTAWTNDEDIFVLVEPDGYGYFGAIRFVEGELTALPPSWIVRIDPATWEVLQEYPHPGYRADWICFDGRGEFMYVPATGNSNLTKINVSTGKIEWTSPTGSGPYGCNVNADGSEIWVADKGESTGHMGRTVTVVDAQAGHPIDTLFSGYAVDHVLLSPDGTEFWATANGEGSIHVFDANTKKKKHVIQMPNGGDPHGLVWVHYDEEGNSRVIRDQGGFHNGIDPRAGAPL